MELTQLKYFLCAAKNQHITKSAEMLHIAQPALTKSIKSLEEELGVPLFAKSGRNIVLTQCGRYFEERLEPLIASLDSLPHEVRRMAEREGETVRICVQSASMPVTEAVVNFRREHPSVNFQITREMTDGLYDIIVTTKMPSSPLPAGKSEVINEEIFLAVPDLPEFRGRDSIELAELRDRGFVSLIGSRYLRVICDRFCHTAGFEPDVIFESDSPDAAKNMIEAGLGVGFWPEYSWGRHPEGGIRLLHSSYPECRRELVIAISPSGIERGQWAGEVYRYMKSVIGRTRRNG